MVQAVEEWTVPRDLHELRAFLGLVGYYMQYIPRFAGVAQPLNQLTAKGIRWQWTQEEHLIISRTGWCKHPLWPTSDPAKEYILNTDASNHSVGAVLSQVQSETEVVGACYSKTLSATKKNYCTTRKELLAVVKAIRHFRPYLYGQTFRLRTDHASLLWLCMRA